MKQYSSWYVKRLTTNVLVLTRRWEDPGTRCAGNDLHKGPDGFPVVYRYHACAQDQADALNQGVNK